MRKEVIPDGKDDIDGLRQEIFSLHDMIEVQLRVNSILDEIIDRHLKEILSRPIKDKLEK